jgi:Putative peptidoglycan binding domain/HEAT repeats
MRLCRYSTLIIVCFTCLSFQSGQASIAFGKSLPEGLQLSQASTSADSNTNLLLRPGSRGEEVQKLQQQLLDLGYYNDKLDGQYGLTTQAAVAKFQQTKNILADGIAGSETRKSIEEAVAAKKAAAPITTPSANTSPKPSTSNKSNNQGFFWWLLIGVGGLGSLGALMYLIRTISRPKKILQSAVIENDTDAVKSQHPSDLEVRNLQMTNLEVTNNGSHRNGKIINEETKVPPQAQLLAPETTSRLAKVNIIDELIQDLRNQDPTSRRKAIWDLGQQGDSRAIQPLVDMLIDSDSQQRSLILASLAEIGSRALKPMNRALAISLQDESPQVRQNAIRDLTRVYDMMAQISQMLSHALDDPDSEVQATAKYALNQMNRIRALPASDNSQEDSRSSQEND